MFSTHNSLGFIFVLFRTYFSDVVQMESFIIFDVSDFLRHPKDNNPHQPTKIPMSWRLSKEKGFYFFSRGHVESSQTCRIQMWQTSLPDVRGMSNCPKWRQRMRLPPCLRLPRQPTCMWNWFRDGCSEELSVWMFSQNHSLSAAEIYINGWWTMW